MTPNKGGTPIKKALAVIFDHPELLTLNPAAARKIQEMIAGMPSFADVWQYISTHPLGDPNAWAELVPIHVDGGSKGDTLYRWQLSNGMRAVIATPLAQVLLESRATATTIGKETTSVAAWTIENIPPRHGLSIRSLSYDTETTSFQVRLLNRYLRHLTVYVEYLADGQAFAPSNWISRLPGSGLSFLETDTLKYLDVLPPTASVAGMTVPSDPVAITLPVPEGATVTRLLFGGLGMGEFRPLIDAAAVLLTAVLDYAVPVILDGARAGTDKTDWYNSLLDDPAIVTEVMTASQFIISNPPATLAELLGAVETRMGALLLGDALQSLRSSIEQNVGQEMIANASPVLGWAEADLAAVAAANLIEGQKSSRILSSPATFSLELVPLDITLTPDPRHGMWPDAGQRYTISVNYNGAGIEIASGEIPRQADAPIVATVAGVPAGGRVEVTASVISAGGWVCGQAQSPVALVPAAGGKPVAELLALVENPVPLTGSTQYRHKCKLSYKNGRHVWETSPPATRVRREDVEASGFQTLIDITLQQAAQMLGYAWKGLDASALYAFQNIAVIDPQAALKFSGSLFSEQPYLVYERDGSAQAAEKGIGFNFYLDTRTYVQDKRLHLRGVTLDDGTPFNLDQKKSWGALYQPPTALTVHPVGYLIACSYNSNTIEALVLPDGPVEMDQAPGTHVILGPGAGSGQIRGPVALDLHSSGAVLVLEQDNERVQAFDPYGNPVPCFKNGSPTFPLKEEAARVNYLDLSVGPQDTVYILSYVGQEPQAEDYRLDLYQADGTFLSRTTGIAAARLVVDGWGRVYTLGYQAFEGPQSRMEPIISQWLPSVPQ